MQASTCTWNPLRGDVQDGEVVFEFTCDPPADHTSMQHFATWRIEVGKTVEPYLSRGSVMPSWRGLSDQEIWQLVAYLKTRSS